MLFFVVHGEAMKLMIAIAFHGCFTHQCIYMVFDIVIYKLLISTISFWNITAIHINKLHWPILCSAFHRVWISRMCALYTLCSNVGKNILGKKGQTKYPPQLVWNDGPMKLCGVRIFLGEGTLPWAISFFFLNEKKINIFRLMHIALFLKVTN